MNSIPESPTDSTGNLTPETPQKSEAYQQLTAGLDAWEWWETATPAQKLAAIVDTYPPENWTDPDCLNVLAVFYDDPVQWLRIVTIGHEIGVNVRQLACAVKTIRERHAQWKFAQLLGQSPTANATHAKKASA